MSDAHMVARDQLRSFIERIERLECEKKTIADDIKDVKAEAKGCGFDVGTINAIIKLRKVDANERAERDAMLDTYQIALGMLPEPGGEDEDYDRETGEVTIIDRDDEDGNQIRVTVDPWIAAILGRQSAVPLRSYLGLNIQTKHEDIRTASVTAEGETGMVLGTGRERPLSIGLHTDGDPEARFETDSLHQDQQMDRATEGSFETGSEAAEKGREAIPAGPEGVDLNHAGAGESPATEKATVATQGEATAPTSDERVSLPVDDRSDAAANAGGDHVASIAERERETVTSNTGEGAANTALPEKPKFVLRPHCLNPGKECGGSGPNHCWSCRRAMQKSEEAA